jgi:hypothetical protein
MTTASVPESNATHGKVSKLGKGLSLPNTTISSQLEGEASVTLLFDNGSTLGPTKDNQIVIGSLAANTQLTGMIIAGPSYLSGQWEVGSKYSTDGSYTLALKGEKVKSEEGQAEKGNLILELSHTGAPTRRVFLHRVAKADFADDDEPPQTGGFELLLTSIADRDEVNPGLRIQNFVVGTSIGFGPISIEPDFNTETARLSGKIKVLGLQVASISMALNQATEINPPDIAKVYRRIRILLWVSKISVDVEIFYEAWDFARFRWKKKHRERGTLIAF